MPDFIINDRQLIPVRMIPFVTGWQWSPDVIARILAHQDDHYCIKIDSYHLTRENAPQKKLPKEWDRIRTDLANISKLLKHEEPVPNSSYKDWRLQAIEAIPPKAFIWLDEFTTAYSKCFPQSRSHLQNGQSRSGDNELNLNPDTTLQEEALIYESFAQTPMEAIEAKPKTVKDKAHTQQRYSKWQTALDDLALQHPRLSHNDLCNKLAKTDIAEGKDASTIRRFTKSPYK